MNSSRLGEGRPSHTALRTAMRRAAHQLIDRPLVFEDPLALSIIGPGPAKRVHGEAAGSRRFHVSTRLRAYLAARSRLAEDTVAAAVSRGVRQHVLLGAGLDTFAYRAGALYPDLRVFEVDHPATQMWKREQLRDATIRVPKTLTFVPVDLTTAELATALTDAGFDPNTPASFAWLGVSMYLTPADVLATLRYIAARPPGSVVVFDYIPTFQRLSLLTRWRSWRSGRRVARAGEPWLSRWDPATLTGELRAMGFTAIEDLGPTDLDARYFGGRSDGFKIGKSAGHMVVAAVG